MIPVYYVLFVDAKAAERLARQDLYPLTRRDSTFPEIETVT